MYAIIGVKMGIRAREYFGAGVDEMRLVSYAGTNPPYSCMNDGLQISTGATLGHGLIEMADDSLKLPQADFTYMGQTIRLRLKDEYRNRIESSVKEFRLIHGLQSNIYWELVRHQALVYWKNWDRHDIFQIERINSPDYSLLE
jgi:pyrimidine-specific ribonucleoside hydrolase